MLTLCAGCSATGSRIDSAAADLGRSQAGVSFPAWPERCRGPVPHARLAEGEELAVLLRRERVQLDQANGLLERCSAFYDALRAGLGGQVQ